MLRKLKEGFFLIGVAHILPQSMHEVKEMITRERPEVVAVELDPYRYALLTGAGVPEPKEKSKPKPSMLILGGLMSLLQSKFSRQTGMAAGEEMLAAMQKAREVGARVQFIDQDIRVTLGRINDLMSLRERVRLMLQIMLGLLPSRKKVNLKELTEDQVVEGLLQEFKRLSPTTYRVLIEERDAYMSSKLLPLLKSGKRVVCVTGAGHIPGIERRLEEALREWKAQIWWEDKIEFESGG